MNHEIAREELRRIYSLRAPMHADKFIMEGGELLLNMAKEAINVRAEKEFYVSIGYYSQDIKIYIGELRSFPNEEIVFLNMLTMEFTADYLLYANTLDREHFKFFLSKYLRNREKSGSRRGIPFFYGDIYNSFRNKEEFDYSQYLSMAGVGVFFLLLPECVHRQRNLVSDAIKLFRNSPTQDFFQNRSDDFLEEIACDFTALMLMVNLDIVKTFGCTEQELLEVILIQLPLEKIYDMFPAFLLKNINNIQDNVRKNINFFNKALDTRLQDLTIAIKAAGNSEFLSRDFDLKPVLEKISKILSTFLIHLSEL